MINLIFAIPLNLGIPVWTVIVVSSLGFFVMFAISSAFGDFQGLITTTLENDAKSRSHRKKK